MEQEIWKDVEGYEGLYQVSNLGQVKSCLTTQGRRKKILIPIKDDFGYMFVSLYKEKKQRHWNIHILVAKSFILNPENKPFINHKNGIKSDNYKDNLEWCTSSENIIHAYKTGLRVAYPQKGEKHGQHILTQIQVNEIREKFKQGEKCKDLAFKYKVSYYCVYDIIKNKTWKI